MKARNITQAHWIWSTCDPIPPFSRALRESILPQQPSVLLLVHLVID